MLDLSKQVIMTVIVLNLIMINIKHNNLYLIY